jgi:hypothetical protein
MVDVLLDTQDVRVLGGPSIVNLELDFGKEGIRGSEIHAGYGKPVGDNLPPSFQLKDLYINVDPADDEYSCVYQYITTVVDENAPANDWVIILRIIPLSFNINTELTFENGVATFLLPLSNLLSPEALGQITKEIINVQITLENLFPTAISVANLNIQTVQSPTVTLLQITFSAAELDGATWTPLEGEHRAQMQLNLAVDQS